VMRRNGLTPAEVEQFQQAVLVACGAQRYPELFPDEDVAYRDDIEQVARNLRFPLHGSSLVCLVACAKHLEGAVMGRKAGRGDPSHLGRQQAALAWLWSAIAWRHYEADRMPQASRLAAANANHVALHFGPRGLDVALTPFTEKMLRSLSITDSKEDRAIRLAYARRYVPLSQESAAGGDERSALKALFAAVGSAWLLSREETAGLLELFHELWGDAGPAFHECLLHASLRLGLLDRAEAHLAGLQRLERFRGKEPILYRRWLHNAGDWTRCSGDYAGAWNYYTEALETDRHTGFVAGERRATEALRKCERAQSRERTFSIAK
jgi:hypothetical protein